MITKMELRQLNGETIIVETNQVLLGGNPAVQVTTCLHGGVAGMIGYYRLVDDGFVEYEGMTYRLELVAEPPDGQITANTDEKTWIDFFEQTRRDDLRKRKKGKDRPAFIYPVEVEHHDTCQFVITFEQVIADGIPAVRVTIKTDLFSPNRAAKPLVVHHAFESALPPTEFLADPVRSWRPWQEIAKAGLPIDLRQKIGEGVWQPKTVTANRDHPTYQDYAAWATAHSRAENIRKTLPKMSDFY
jgi:hypothetical protein